MKRILYISIFIICCILISCGHVWATGATANIVKYRQPDGSIISLKMFGDEFFAYSTTLDGYIVAIGNDGYCYYANYDSGYLNLSGNRVTGSGLSVKSSGSLFFAKAKGIPDGVAASLRKYAANVLKPEGDVDGLSYVRHAAQASETDGAKHSLVLLVQFADTLFTVNDTKSHFNGFLNEKGYSYNGARGSVADYFNYNFNGKCSFSFDVSDIITLSREVSYYGEHTAYLNDANAAGMVVEACKTASENGIDFSKYDSDNDGVVDNVAIIFAGLNEAESGIASAIWPHKGDISDKNIFCNGVKIASYTCTSEYSADAVNRYPASIGSFCHEYSHSLGLVDMYDVNGDEEGQAECLYGKLSIMDRGNYLDKGNTPPLFNAIERQMLGIAAVKDLEEAGSYKLLPIGETDTIYRVKSVNEGEYFLLECREQRDWDSYIGGEGLVIYHVDKSSNICGGLSAASRWQLNIVNSYAQHECARVMAADPLNTSEQTPEYLFYPGKSSVTSLAAMGEYPFVDWQHSGLGIAINDIRYTSGLVEFSVVEDVIYKEDVPSAMNLKVDTYQNHAFCSWNISDENYGGDGVWNMTIENDEGFYKKIKIGTDTLYHLFDGLEPGKDYRIRLHFMDDNYMGEVKIISFRTDGISSEYPFIKLSGGYRAGDIINICVQNLVERHDSVEILINGEKLSGNSYKLEEPGVYEVEVVIKYPDKSMDIIQKRLNVKK